MDWHRIIFRPEGTVVTHDFHYIKRFGVGGSYGDVDEKFNKDEKQKAIMQSF